MLQLRGQLQSHGLVHVARQGLLKLKSLPDDGHELVRLQAAELSRLSPVAHSGAVAIWRATPLLSVWSVYPTPAHQKEVGR